MHTDSICVYWCLSVVKYFYCKPSVFLETIFPCHGLSSQTIFYKKSRHCEANPSLAVAIYPSVFVFAHFVIYLTTDKRMNTDSIRVYQCASVVKPFFYESAVVFEKQIFPSWFVSSQTILVI